MVRHAINNIVRFNTFAYNQYGIWIESPYGSEDALATRNKIYMNNFIDNTMQGYDGGYDNRWDTGNIGNFWSDYTGVDCGGMTYPWDTSGKHLIADDGIGDTLVPHMVDEDSGDYYPIIRLSGWIPTADAGPDQTVNTGNIVFFSGIGSWDLDGWIVNYTWDFDDGYLGYGMNITHIYLFEGIYNVTLMVTDNDGFTATDYCIIIVLSANEPPVANVNGPYSGEEGSPITFDASGSYDIDNDTLQYRWDLDNDGIWDTGWSSNPTIQNTWGDDYSGQVVVEVTDGEFSDTASASVTVHNALPVVEAGSDQTADEGDIVSFSGSFIDPGLLDTHTILWSFGDGVTMIGTLNPNHIYADNGDYVVILTVTDDDNGVGSDSMVVSVNNVAPDPFIWVISSLPDPKEGEQVGFTGYFNDPGFGDTFTITWDFGDGTVISGDYYHAEPINIDWYLELENHTYGDNGRFTVTLTVEDDDGGEGVETFTAIVINIAPTTEPLGPFIINEGSPFDLIAVSTDPGSDDLTFTWNWGDGTSDAVTTYYNDGSAPDPYPSPWGTYPFTATDNVSHTYGDNGVYTVTLTVEDDDGDITTYTTNVTVINVLPVFDSVTASGGDEGALITYSSTVTDSGSDDLTFTWNWGDGTSNTVTIYYNDGSGPDPFPSPLGTYPFTATDTISHTYGDNGVYLITLTVEDDDNGTNTYSTNVTINNIAPTIDSTTLPGGDEGDVLTYISTAMDQGSDDLTFTWSWGDGTSNTVTIYYNDGSGPDPYPSPWGTYPFTATDTVQHTYGDNGVYTLIMTIEDDDYGIFNYTTNITVNNVAPTINSITAPNGDEGALLTFSSIATDKGSDDLTFTWNWGDGTSESVTIYYNDGSGPDPFPSPWGTYPFTASDSVQHIYGDNGVYSITLTVEDDDDGLITYTTNVTIENVAPTIDSATTPGGDEGAVLTYISTSTDPGSDDLTFTWNWGDGTSDTITIYYNDGSGPDPFPSPLGTYPFTATDTQQHTYGDNGDYTIILTVEDDDRGTTTYITNITIYNVAPTIDYTTTPGGNEGAVLTYISEATDPGSDDLTFTWDWGDGTSDSVTVYYNDGANPDPYPSPWGTYPFTATDMVEHIYGDNGVYTITLTVVDDDNGETSYTTNVTIDNVAPTITPFGPFSIDEGSPLDLTAISTDPGSDDLMFTWVFEMGSTITNVHYNDGSGPDPYPSPWGTFPFSVSDMVEHSYGDDGVYTLTLTVEDDDDGIASYTTTITVNNVAPTIENVEAYILIDFKLRIAGEKWHDVTMFVYKDDEEIGNISVVRYPGNPDEQSVTLSNVKCDVTKAFTVKILYTPDNDPVNGQPNGATPVWVTIDFEDGEDIRLHHTCNVRHPETWEWNIGVNQYIIGHKITFEAEASDQGSDDLTFSWEWGDGCPLTETLCCNDGISPEPFYDPILNKVRSPWGTCPFSALDVKKHTFSTGGNHSVTLTVTDDDGGVDVIVVIVIIG
ncbi:MAG: PKD domain-containing protein [Thermoplasmata archaeon]|nr:MAG: PKD domain-containing protein [Thermoplasmata archaeon]